MNKAQIKELALSIAENSGASDKVFGWITKNLSKAELKYFLRALAKSAKEVSVKVSYAGEFSGAAKQNLQAAFKENEILNKIFGGKNINYVSDNALLGGIKIESGDYALEYSLKALTSQIIKSLKESL